MEHKTGNASLKYAFDSLEGQKISEEIESNDGCDQTVIKQWNSTISCCISHEITNQPEEISISIPTSPNPAKMEKMKPIEMKFNSKSEARMRSKDCCYDTFKTHPGHFERGTANLQRKKKAEMRDPEAEEAEALPATERYFDALQGPELDSLKASETLLLPEDEKWPFLLRFPISTFAISLGLSIQAFLWKTLATSPPMSFLHVKLTVSYIIWCLAVAEMIVAASIYLLKAIIFFEAVRREFFHPIRVNLFFAPWISCILLIISSPPSVERRLHHQAVWYIMMAPVLILELKIYGEWMMGGERRLSKVANPVNHLPVAGNFAVAFLGSFVGLKEGPIFFFSIGFAHYVVLFVTLYQRLPTNETLPKELHPVFFLFVAAPSIACLSWTMIAESFDLGSRMAYFLSMFLYASLVVRFNFFRGFRFSLAWWAYTAPMSTASVATIYYTAHVTNLFTKILSTALSLLSSLTVISLLIVTIIHAFVFRTLFPNDIGIAITVKRSRKKKKKNSHARVANLPSSIAVDKTSSSSNQL